MLSFFSTSNVYVAFVIIELYSNQNSEWYRETISSKIFCPLYLQAEHDTSSYWIVMPEIFTHLQRKERENARNFWDFPWLHVNHDWGASYETRRRRSRSKLTDLWMFWLLMFDLHFGKHLCITSSIQPRWFLIYERPLSSKKNFFNNHQAVKIFFSTNHPFLSKNPSVDWFFLFLAAVLGMKSPTNPPEMEPPRRQDWYAGSMAPGFSLPQHLGMKEKWQVGIMDQWTCVDDVVWQV